MIVLLGHLLRVAAAAASASSPATPAEPICRKIEITGSLVRKERVCKTKAEWRQSEDWGNRRARAIMEHSAGRPLTDTM